ncbi:sensor histidine kinase [Acetivibrio straminisolvens]|uniref:histidine kinase n=1 Tax=Acetivibrio straminisolvens JCM 21531 TaxID=1294263 RepID=W4VBP0_9FIRM|nr:histidine kinase [Acetivibrio straminisolvens]GAE90825.1 two-component system response regulator [Acetivibrio straminisolvens JCM 21531]
MARDVHDTLGQTLSILITLLQVSILTCKKNAKETENNLKNALKITREGLNEVRRSISGLSPKKLEEMDFFDALERLAADFEYSGLDVELSVNKIQQNIGESHKEVIYRICQEALANSLKHGKATKANIIIKFTDSYISLFIFDDGEVARV